MTVELLFSLLHFPEYILGFRLFAFLIEYGLELGAMLQCATQLNESNPIVSIYYLVCTSCL